MKSFESLGCVVNPLGWTARLGVAEVRSNVATFFMSQYTNFIQFGGESDGALDAHKSLSF